MDAHEPALSVLGVTKVHADRAIRWLRNRSFLAFYNKSDRSLCAFEFKHGRERTYEILQKALQETAR
jgi:hypothetical protein